MFDGPSQLLSTVSSSHISLSILAQRLPRSPRTPVLLIRLQLGSKVPVQNIARLRRRSSSKMLSKARIQCCRVAPFLCVIRFVCQQS
ncbi:hypothetical protein M3J09_009086 [Ascochyta lentis]